MPHRMNKILALLLLFGAIGGFGLSARRSYQVQDQSRYGAPVGPVRTAYVGEGDRIFFILFGLVCLVGSGCLIVSTRK